MSSNRQDAWNEQEDELLAKTVLESIENGQTQLDAFALVGKKLSRTAAACGFRWNSYVRKLYENEILLAKKKKKDNKLKQKKELVKKQPDLPAASPEVVKTPELDLPSLDVMITYVEKLYTKFEQQLMESKKRVRNDHQLEELQHKVHALEAEKSELLEELYLLKQEFTQLAAIINKANNLVGK